MYSVQMTVDVPGHGRDDVFDTIVDFARYPELVDAVKEVEVLPAEPDGAVPSRWVVFFRKGLLCWSETDVFNRPEGTITFTQQEGDFDVFEGDWALREVDGVTSVTFRASFDFGVPSMASIIDPVAGRVLIENMEMIIAGLFRPTEVRVTTAEHGPAQ